MHYLFLLLASLRLKKAATFHTEDMASRQPFGDGLGPDVGTL